MRMKKVETPYLFLSPAVVSPKKKHLEQFGSEYTVSVYTVVLDCICIYPPPNQNSRPTSNCEKFKDRRCHGLATKDILGQNFDSVRHIQVDNLTM